MSKKTPTPLEFVRAQQLFERGEKTWTAKDRALVVRIVHYLADIAKRVERGEFDEQSSEGDAL